MTQIIDLLGFFLIVLMLFMQWQIYVTRVVLTFAVSSLLIAATMVYAGITTGAMTTVAIGVLTAAVRGVTIPAIVVRGLHDRPHRVREHQPVIPTATSIFVSLALVLFAYALYSGGLARLLGPNTGFLPFALLLQGGFLIVSRRNAFIQLVGYLSMENALLLLGSLVLPGVPFVLEAGVVLDLFGVVIISRIIMRLRESGGPDRHEHEELFG